jgi:transcriptional regulator with XRE-family HTH domain
VTAGQLVEEVRKRHGLTQAQLAARAQTSQAAISRIERDLVSPSVELLARLIDLMGEELELQAHPVPVSVNMEVLTENLQIDPEDRIEQGAGLGNILRGHPPRSVASPTLHYEIASILSEHGNGWMTTEELAAEVNARGRYKRTRTGDVTAYQVHGRTKNYGEVFVRKGARVRLAGGKRLRGGSSAGREA